MVSSFMGTLSLCMCIFAHSLWAQLILHDLSSTRDSIFLLILD